MKRVFIPLWKALKEAREDDPMLTETDGICACYEIENMGFCRDGVTRWYHFTSVDWEPAYTLKRQEERNVREQTVLRIWDGFSGWTWL